ncbi:DUF2871 family protein [Vagococcus lutrae]|nr:DUF2871 family protein [Vagococcus lutrae]MDT2808707.1 DUF2871 family protein [Vagococcus lutrae]
MMTKLTRTSAFYGILGLVLGFYYRELTKMNDGGFYNELSHLK